MAVPWFFIESMPDGGVAALARDEAKHATGARRLGAGDGIVLFDGRGAVARATLLGTRSACGDVELRIDEIERHEAISPRIELATALPKGDRISTLLDTATQAGVDHLIPLRCEWGVVKPREETPERWRRIVVEAAKQSRRAWVPGFGPPMTVEEASRGDDMTRVLIAHPGGASLPAVVSGADSLETIRVLIGPEGGFSDPELAAAESAGATRVSLSPHVLRIETAALAAVVMIRAR